MASIEYVKLDLTSPNYQKDRDQLAAAFKVAFPQNSFSENVNKGATMSWCKCVAGSGVAGTDKATYATKQKVQTDCYDTAWVDKGTIGAASAQK